MSLNLTSAAMIRAFFREEICKPLVKNRPQDALNFAPDKTADTYYVPARRPRMSRADMEAMVDLSELDQLGKLWEQSGCRFSGEIDTLKAITQALLDESRDSDDGTSDSLSEYVYQMW